MMTRRIFAPILALSFLFSACPSEEGTFERAGKNIDKALDEAKDETKEAAESVKNKMRDALDE